MDAEIIIIGAGPSGLMAARGFASAGKKVLVLEARDRTGGRAYTTYDDAGESIERGAEFIHGKLPLSFSLLKEAGLSYTAAGGRWIHERGGSAFDDSAAAEWPVFLKTLKTLKDDMSLEAFLDKHFAGEQYTSLRDRAIGYAEGYDAADASRVSVKALYEEWSRVETEDYRIDEGFSGLTDYLEACCTKKDCRILLSHPVSAVDIDPDGVSVTSNGKLFRAEKLLVALPLGVLQGGGVRFDVSATRHLTAMQGLGFGHAIKIILRFGDAFWEDIHPGLGFLFSAAEVPTWWTQAPEDSTVLTGWLAGRSAVKCTGLSKRQILEVALESLSTIFDIDAESLKSELEEVHIVNWSADPYTMGAYAYATVASAPALALLSQPVAGRAWFAGEYLYQGAAMGTVEAALVSGRDVSNAVLSSWK